VSNIEAGRLSIAGTGGGFREKREECHLDAKRPRSEHGDPAGAKAN